MIDKEKTKFWFKEQFKDIIITLRYLVREPFYDLKRLVKGYYNSTLIFWFTVGMFFYVWHKTGKPLKVLGVIVILVYIYMFHESGVARKNYEKEMIEGKKIE